MASKVPMVTNADYRIPGWVCKNTLVVACSNSGNTEETLQATSEAVKRGACVACVTSGGKLSVMNKICIHSALWIDLGR